MKIHMIVYYIVYVYTCIYRDITWYAHILRHLTAEMINDAFKEDYTPLEQKVWSKLSS